ncbi:phosphatidylserine decarboxylase [Magnetospira sp. QH-2]|uniref:phosphatidylserine decarboxylase n=1 Tax=Magnetospira sp. (strain QH-2) TaxID=1288970 RepID=UPI0003E80E4B|nr:phosphatidylserine decarboxylase [Magnetospira sp. QH-2]CCQ74304.1 Phosphatidylserine decarboxylase [Magnetospira sp. QH-2]
MLNVILVPIHPAGWPFIGIFAVATVILGSIAEPLGWIGLILTAWCAYFFRNPDRVTPQREGLVISPADGVVQKIDRATPPPELEMGDAERPRICVFMNVFNVHVNRAPLGGKVIKLAYRPGKFFNASLDKASEFNERQSVRLAIAETGHSTPREIAFVQIAGLVARRIKCFVTEGQEIKTGERFGLIRFGSRVDVYLPEGIAPLVVEGQTTLAGETVIADLHGTEGKRTGEVR